MPYNSDLTTLQALKDWILPGFGNVTSSDSQLATIISSVSNTIQRYLSRDLEYKVYKEIRNGQGRDSIRTLRYPIVSVQNVEVSPFFGGPKNVITPTGQQGPGGLTYSKWFINLQQGWFGSRFPEGHQNLILNYSAGFILPGQLAVQQLPQWPGAGLTVKQGAQCQANGYYFTCMRPGVTSNPGPPAWPVAGQTGIDNTQVTDGQVIWVLKGIVTTVFPPTAEWLPSDIEEACLQQSALVQKQRSRIGDQSTGVGADRVNYFMKAMHPTTIEMLIHHKEVFPTDGMGVQ